jgi:hypothetical protein
MMQKLQIQFSQLTTHLQWNENFDFTLMEILKNNYNPQLQYVVSLFNISCNTHITKKIKIIFNIYLFFKIPINYEIFSSPSTLMFKTKVQKISKLQTEHFQNLIVNLSLKQDFYFILIRHFIIIIFLN